MRAIPEKTRRIIDSDPFFEKCCIADNECSSSYMVQIHHELIYRGKQCNDLWALLPLCEFHHSNEKSYKYRHRIEYVMLLRMLELTTIEDVMLKYPRINWLQLLNYHGL